MSNIKSLGDLNVKGRTKQTKTNKYENLDPIKTFPEEVTKIVGVVADYDKNIVFLSSEGKLYQSMPGKFHEKLKALENLPPMKSISSGYFHFIALSNEEKPRVYGWGDNVNKQLGFITNNDEVQKPTLIESLKEQNIDQISCSGYCSFFINKTTNILFGCGDTHNGMLGKPEIKEDYAKIQKLHENVANVFGGHSEHTLIIKTDGKLYGFGFNNFGKLF
ncbi:ubiquitin-protein ligase e3a-related [Anaeramoeba flamelloides]|uniref:Ubiquitin-protein ligase e3a-related n=1 Tax=Anaeramoeba flamelloides TaxID=1746091 RepID=A0AAV8A453_9EUKA|nr:ubiquitin-protein ligase e3a-related [Anaeramoeba flamelloides]